MASACFCLPSHRVPAVARAALGESRRARLALSRNPADLPHGFLQMSNEEAVGLIRGTDGLMTPETADNSLKRALRRD